MIGRAESIEDTELVSCQHCGIVYDLKAANDLTRCPVCETTGDRVAVPPYGYVRKWWVEL